MLEFHGEPSEMFLLPLPFFFPLFAYNLKIILSIVKYSKKSFDGGMDILMKIKAKEPPRPTSVPMCNVTLG